MLSLFSLPWKRPLPPIKGTFWITRLPLELLLKVMSCLSREYLESLITALDMDFTGVVQYVEDTSSIFPRHHKLRTVNLKDLDHERNKSMMNIVIIKNPGMLDLKRMGERLSGSINLFILSNVKVDMSVQFKFLPNILEKILYPKFCRTSSPFHVSDSDMLRVRFRDVSQVCFKNINKLILVRCKVGGRPQQFTISRVKFLHLVACSRKIIRYNIAEYENKSDVPTSDFLLHDLYINCGELMISHCDVRNLIFNGTSLVLFSELSRRQPQTITKVRAPKLCDLKIQFDNSPSVLIDFYAPKLKNVEIIKWGMTWYPQPDFNDNTQEEAENYRFLHRVEVLRLRFYWEPLFKVQFKYLSTLTLYMHTNLGPVENDFPRLETLHIFLMEEADLVPTIKADFLISLTVTSRRNLGRLTHDQARRWYPRLRWFSYSWSPRFIFL
jgi:hypothetical protein